VVAAIQRANLVLERGGASLRLEPAWVVSRTVMNRSAIRVFWMDGGSAYGLPSAYTASDCAAIILDANRLGGFLIDLTLTPQDRLKFQPFAFRPPPLPVGKPEDLLALILLHEAGHVASGTAGSYDSHLLPAIPTQERTNSTRGQISGPDAIPKEVYRMTESKNNEVKADLWCADWIRLSRESDGDQEAVQLGEPFLALAGNWLSRFARERWLNHPYQTPLITRAFNPNQTAYGRREVVYGDGSISHPNIELRMLIIRDRVLRTEEARKALIAYLNERHEMAILELVDSPSRKAGPTTIR
jgi:hypothetical protein